MHLDGLIAYDRDASQIGKYLFEDPLYKPYPSLLDWDIGLWPRGRAMGTIASRSPKAIKG